MGPGLVKQQRQEVTEAVNHQIIKSAFRTAIQPISILPNVIELSYYGNTMVLHYILESIVGKNFEIFFFSLSKWKIFYFDIILIIYCYIWKKYLNIILISVTALYADLKSKINDPRAIAENNIIIFQDNLVERALEVCDILKYEFIFCRPCQELEHVLVDVIRSLCTSGIISLIEESYLQEEIWSRRYAKTFDDSSDEEYSNVNRTKKIQYKVSVFIYIIFVKSFS